MSGNAVGIDGNEVMEKLYGDVDVNVQGCSVSGNAMLEFVRSSINGSGEKLPDVAILRKDGLPAPLAVGEKGAAESAFVYVDVGKLDEKGDRYDVSKVRVPYQCYSQKTVGGGTYLHLMDWVCDEVLKKSIAEIYGTGVTVKVYSI